MLFKGRVLSPAERPSDLLVEEAWSALEITRARGINKSRYYGRWRRREKNRRNSQMRFVRKRRSKKSRHTLYVHDCKCGE